MSCCVLFRANRATLRHYKRIENRANFRLLHCRALVTGHRRCIRGRNVNCRCFAGRRGLGIAFVEAPVLCHRLLVAIILVGGGTRGRLLARIIRRPIVNGPIVRHSVAVRRRRRGHLFGGAFLYAVLREHVPIVDGLCAATFRAFGAHKKRNVMDALEMRQARGHVREAAGAQRALFAGKLLEQLGHNGIAGVQVVRQLVARMLRLPMVHHAAGGRDEHLALGALLHLVRMAAHVVRGGRKAGAVRFVAFGAVFVVEAEEGGRRR